MSLADNVRKYVENRENAMIEDIEAISGDTCGETIRLNDDFVHPYAALLSLSKL